MDGKLHNLMLKLTEWCQHRGIAYDLVADEDDLQGALVFSRYQPALPRLRAFLAPLLARDGLYERAVTTRAGTVLLYALSGLNEGGISEDVVARFRDDLVPAYLGALDRVLLAPELPVREASYTFPGKRQTLTRSSWPNFANKTEDRNKGSRLPTRGHRLVEDLQGIAAAYDPNEVKQSLGGIMRGLGLDSQLQQAGIKNKVSDDGQYVIFYNIDQQGQPQPIIRYELSDLGEEAKMYEALDFLADLAKREAPGTGKQQRDKAKEQEQAMRQLIKSKLPRRPEDDQQQSLLQPAQPAQPQMQPVGGAKGGGFPAMPESVQGSVQGSSGVNFHGRVAAALLS